MTEYCEHDNNFVHQETYTYYAELFEICFRIWYSLIKIITVRIVLVSPKYFVPRMSELIVDIFFLNH